MKVGVTKKTYIDLKSMEISSKKANYKKIAIWTIVISAIIIIPDASMYWQQFKVLTAPLPEKYKSFTELDNFVDNYYEIIRIDGGFIEPTLQANDSTIIIISAGLVNYNKEGFIENKWYTVNLKGQLTDSLVCKFRQNEDQHLETFNDYILNTDQDTYNTWIINKDSTSIPIQNIAADKRFTKKEVESLLDKDQYLAINYTDTLSGESKSASKLFYFKNNSWNFLITDQYFYNSSTYQENEKKIAYTATPYDTSALFKRSFVHKEHWVERSFWNIGKNLTWGTGNQSPTSGWTGTSYFEIQMPRKNIHFKQFVAIDQNGIFRDRFSYYIYKPIGGDYLLLNDIENSRYYLIRQKLHQ